MGIRKKSSLNPPPPDPSLYEKMGGWRGLGGTGIRALSGLLASEGGVPGALIGGGGELGAELFEGSSPSLGRIGTEAALSAVPFSAIMKEGRPLISAARGGAYAGVGAGAREVAQGENLDPTAIGEHALAGGALTGALAKLFGTGSRVAKVPVAKAAQYEVETTAVPGGRALGGGKLTRGGGNKPDKLTGAKLSPIKAPPAAQVNAPVRPPVLPPEPTPLDFSSKEAYLASRGLKAATPNYALPDEELTRTLDEFGGGAVEGGRVPYTGTGAHPSGSAAKSQVREVETSHSVANKIRKEELAAAANKTRLDEIQRTIDSGKMTAQPASVSESVSAKTPEGGTLRQSTAFKRPKAGTMTESTPGEGGFGEEDLTDVLDEGGVPAPRTRPVGPAPPAPAAEMGDESFITRLRRIGFHNLAQRVANGEVTEEEALKVAAMRKSMAAHPEAAPTVATPTQPPVAEIPLPVPTPAPASFATENLDDITQAAEAPIPTPQVRAARGVRNKILTPRQQAQKQSLDELRGRIEAEGQAAPPTEPVTPSSEFDAAKNRQVHGKLMDRMGELTDEEIKTLDSVDDFGKPLSAADRGIEEVTPVAAPAEEPPSALAKFFKSPVDAAGETFRAAKAEEGINPLAKRQLGIALGTEAQKAGLPTKGVNPDTLKKFLEGHVSPELSGKMGRPPLGAEVPPTAPPVPSKGPSLTESTPAPIAETGYEEDLKKVQAMATKLKAEGVPESDIPHYIADLMKRSKGEAGAVDPAFLAFLAKTGLGAAAGGIAGGAVGHPFIGMAAGAGLANAPAILSQLGAHPSTYENLQDKLSTEGVKGTAQKIYRTLPQVQRFNYLTSPTGMAANALVGPYGSAVMGALEHALTATLEGSGDTRGWVALRNLTPNKFWSEYKVSFDEAKRLLAAGELGRAESTAFSPTLKLGDKALQPLQIPGTAMTAGDVAARKILVDAGFTEEEARRITLTSEPEANMFRWLTNAGRGKQDWSTPIIETALPFKRTPANIWEQGAQRFPGLGRWVQNQRELPDPLKQQIVQQLMSIGVGGASAFVGANLDPEMAKTARRFITNFAGQYSLPATMGFAAGQAFQTEKPIIPAAISGGIRQLPLPATQSIEDFAGFLFGDKSIPRGAIPAVISDNLSAPTPSGIRPLRLVRRRR